LWLVMINVLKFVYSLQGNMFIKNWSRIFVLNNVEHNIVSDLILLVVKFEGLLIKC